MNRPKWLAVAVLVGVFALGMVAGGGAVAAFHGKQRRDWARRGFGMHGERPMMALMQRVMKLDEQQRKSVESILDLHAARRHDIMVEMMKNCGQELQQEKTTIDQEIRAVLTPIQRQKFDELSERQRERFFGGPPPGPPRPDPRHVPHGDWPPAPPHPGDQ